MTEQSYDWTRYWYPRPREDSGSNIDDGSRYGQLGPILWRNSARRYEITDLMEVPCLVLLGEPGMGKTQALINAKNTLTRVPDTRCRFFNLAHFESRSEVVREVFLSDPDFVEWQAGDFVLHLFLDSLDEAIFDIKEVTELIYEHLAKQSARLDRLRLRIACRTADWSRRLEKQFGELWGKDAVGVFVLAPLQRQDVFHAAQRNGLDVDQFATQLQLKDAWPFAERPVTLNFLIDHMLNRGELPESRSDLYRQGCLSLCREHSVSHKGRDKLQPEQRLAIAAQIAALMVFSGRSTISTNETDSFSFQDYSGSKVVIDSLDLEIYESSVLEVLDTALFQGGRIRHWAHRTYAEFLAGWYAAKVFEVPQIRSLIFHHDGKLVPQVQETAAWIASYNAEIFTTILNSDPDVLLRSDVVASDVSFRQRLTQALLTWFETEPIALDVWTGLRVLDYPGLAQALRPYLEDRSKNTEIRSFAIRCAIDCELGELQDEFVRIALDSDEPDGLRVLASRAIVKIGDVQAKLSLKDFAFLSPVNRVFERMKTLGILATWPHGLSPAELFSTLDVPEGNQGYIGLYHIQDWRRLILPELSVVDIPLALKWVREHRNLNDLSPVFSQLRDGILLLAWELLEEPGVASAFAETAISLWQVYDGILDRSDPFKVAHDDTAVLTREVVLQNNQKRYLLLQHLIPLAAMRDEKGSRLIAYNFVEDVPLISFTDAQWLIENYRNCPSVRECTLIAHLIRRIIDLGNAEHFEFIYDAGQKNPELWRALDYRLFFELDSEEARQAQHHRQQQLDWERNKKQREERRKKGTPDPPPLERALRNLKACEDGDVDGWWRMSSWMPVSAEGNVRYDKQWEIDMTKLPVWELMETETQAKVIEMAQNFISGFNPAAVPWQVKSGTIFQPIVAGCRAFCLLINKAPSVLASLPEEAWRKWAPAVVFQSNELRTFLLGVEAGKQIRLLWQHFYRNAPEEFELTLLRLIDQENLHDHLNVTNVISQMMDAHLAIVLLEKAKEDQLTVNSFRTLMERVTRHNFSIAAELLTSLVPIPVPVEDTLRRRALVACGLLLLHAPDSGWSVVWPAIRQDADFGMTLVRQVATQDRLAGSIPAKLAETEAADLYIWLVHHFPPENDPEREGGHEVTSDYEIADFRDITLRQLMNRGTEESVRQLECVGEALGIDLTRAIWNARATLREKTWQRPTSNQILALIQDRQKRWIKSGQQLLDVIVEVLAKLNDELQGRYGATPAAIDLWNECKVKRDGKDVIIRTPKDEGRISDYIQRFLRRELVTKNVFVAREVQIRRGSFTDVYVETTPILGPGDFGEPISAVVEVKGCWNRNINEDMEKQLKSRYLQQNGLQNGIYLIAQFMCGAWSNVDDKVKCGRCREVADSEVQLQFETQAADLSRDGFDIRAQFLNARLIAGAS